MRAIWIGSAVGMLLAGAAVAAHPGQETFDKSCKTCHGAQGQGNPAMAKVLKVTMRQLGAKEVQAKTDDQLREDIAKGTGKMKPVAGLSKKQVDDLVGLIRTLKQ